MHHSSVHRAPACTQAPPPTPHRATQTAPELRRYTVGAFIPPSLTGPAAALLEQLPGSICSLPRERIEELPAAFKAQICPYSALLAAGGGNSSTWGTALAEVVLGGGGGAASKGAVDGWLRRMCRCARMRA